MQFSPNWPTRLTLAIPHLLPPLSREVASNSLKNLSPNPFKKKQRNKELPSTAQPSSSQPFNPTPNSSFFFFLSFSSYFSFASFRFPLVNGIGCQMRTHLGRMCGNQTVNSSAGPARGPYSAVWLIGDKIYVGPLQLNMDIVHTSWILVVPHSNLI